MSLVARIRRCVGDQYIPYRSHDAHNMWVQRSREGAQQLTQRHYDLFTEKVIAVARQRAPQDLHKCCDIVEEYGKKERLSSFLERETEREKEKAD